jgi:hypothetical protein
MPCRAIHGGRVGNRVQADAAGRRGHFHQGRCPPDSDSVALEGNAPSGGAKRTRRPGFEIRDRGRGRDRDRHRKPRPSVTPRPRSWAGSVPSPEFGKTRPSRLFFSAS